MSQLNQRQFPHFHTIVSILGTGSLDEREGRSFIEKYLENAELLGEDRVQIRKAVVEWQAEQAKKEAEKRRELERQRRIAELEAESKPIQREARTLSEKMQRKGWSTS